MTTYTRRSILKISTGAAASATLLPNIANANALGWKTNVVHALPIREKPQRLFIQNRRTGEVFDDIVRRGMDVFDEAYEKIDHLMRDWRRDEVIQIDRPLIDRLLAVQSEVGYDHPILVVSGYRSQKTNDMLRRKIRRVAKDSYHIKGMAVDFRIDGVSSRRLRSVTVKQKAGGVGYYPSRGFIHLDTGPVRSWSG